MECYSSNIGSTKKRSSKQQKKLIIKPSFHIAFVLTAHLDSGQPISPQGLCLQYASMTELLCCNSSATKYVMRKRNRNKGNLAKSFHAAVL
jgi:hypothetical protein